MLLVSDQAGRSNCWPSWSASASRCDRDDPRLARLLDEVKEREALGYAYEGADASFDLLAQRMLGEVPDFFTVERFRVDVERRHNAIGELVTVAEAIVKVRVDGELLISAAEGNGPVNALDVALRKDLGKYQQLHRGAGTARLQGAHLPGRHRGGDARADRERRRRASAGRRWAFRRTSSTRRSRR